MTAQPTVLIANRGEIACRIIRTARTLDMRTVAIYSDADADAPHVRDADEARHVGPAQATESYLNIHRIVAAARDAGADLIHPGYGFLSENEAFARACVDAGLTFVGPSPDVIGLMGNKRRAKDRMRDARVPSVPGWQGEDQSPDAIGAAAHGIGLPVMLKAAAGGGGRGMRIVRESSDLSASIESARSEAQNAFGDGTLLIEKLIERGRHVEVQIFGDQHGTVVHLGARDCSTQRRHQKVIEEAPPAFLKSETIDALCAAAVQAGRAIDYVGAGTVEFLVDRDEAFYFLEMNTRLQVEHPVTEMITGEDLVAWQLDVACGKPLPKSRSEIAFDGHSIEARVYAEDPDAGFLPQSGPVLSWRAPAGEGVRVDSGIVTGGEISSAYDPMVAKVVAHGGDREQARLRLIAALEGTTLFGVRSNKAFLLHLLRTEAFADGRVTTDFIDQGGVDVGGAAPDGRDLAAAAVLLFEQTAAQTSERWWSTGAPRSLMVVGQADAIRFVSVMAMRGGGTYEVSFEDQTHEISTVGCDDAGTELSVDGMTVRLDVSGEGASLWLDRGEGAQHFEDLSYVAAEPASQEADGIVAAKMAGRVVRAGVAEGDRVAAGDLLVILESMKIEHAIAAPVSGQVSRVAVAAGDQVAARTLLVEITPEMAQA